MSLPSSELVRIFESKYSISRPRVIVDRLLRQNWVMSSQIKCSYRTRTIKELPGGLFQLINSPLSSFIVFPGFSFIVHLRRKSFSALTEHSKSRTYWNLKQTCMFCIRPSITLYFTLPTFQPFKQKIANRHFRFLTKSKTFDWFLYIYEVQHQGGKNSSDPFKDPADLNNSKM